MILINEKFDNNQHKINYDKQMLLDYQNKILKYDDYWFKNEYDKNKYKLLNRRKNKIVNEFGISYLPLRTYKNKLTNKNITPTRIYIDIDKYKNYTNSVNKLIILNANLNNITYPIIKHNLKINISLSTICRRLKKTIIFVEELPQEKIKILSTDYIYIQSDESYNNLIDNKKKKI